MDAIIDILLPGCLPYKLTRYASQAVERTNNIYDTMSDASNDQTIEATCCLHSASPSTLLDWPAAYAAEKDSLSIIKALRQYKSTSIPLDIIKSVYMSYMPSIKKENIVFTWGQTIILQSNEYG